MELCSELWKSKTHEDKNSAIQFLEEYSDNSPPFSVARETSLYISGRRLIRRIRIAKIEAEAFRTFDSVYSLFTIKRLETNI
jgi:hypothetical protein